MKFKIFFSYTHKDEQLLEKLKEHLAPLKNQGLIDQFWHDRDISAGAEWEPEIVRHLDAADIILLLISAPFMNSEYCYGKELQRAIMRHERKEARVIPIILSPVDWQIPPLHKLQALPTDARPITGAGWHSVDEALLNVVKGIRAVVNDMQKRQRPGSSYQYHINHITEQVNQGYSAIAALNQYDPELGRLFGWVMNLSSYEALKELCVEIQAQRDALQTQVEKLVSETCGVAEGDLRVQAEVTPDALGVLADAFNYVIEELDSNIGRTRATAARTIDKSAAILKILRIQRQTTEDLEQLLAALMKSLPAEAYSAPFSKITTLTRHMYTFVDRIESDISDIGDLFDQLRKSTSMFRLRERLYEEKAE